MHRFRKVFITTSLIFGLATAVINVLFYGSNWLAAIATGLLAGLLYGSILGGCAYLFTRSRKVTLFSRLTLALSLSAVGLISGLIITLGLDKLPREEWSLISSPPEKPMRFIGNSAFNFWGGSVYVETETGNIYSYTCDSSNPCEWKKENALPGEPQQNFWSCPPGYAGGYWTPPIFKPVRDAYEVNICGVDYTNQINLIILEEGTVWVWNRFSSSMEDMMFFPAWVVASFGAGLSGYITLSFRKDKDQW